MFYFLIAPILTWHYILITAAIIPAVFLMRKVYQSDHLEKESSAMLTQMVQAGILSTMLALIEERIGCALLYSFLPEGTLASEAILYFLIVGGAEESSKYIMLKRRSWNSPEFNCQYDGVVYAVFVSLGFALWENINYVLHYGFITAVVRAVTAIPGHACFGVFMGVFYGLAKSASLRGDAQQSRTFRVLAVLVPMLIHGAYDFIASDDMKLIFASDSMLSDCAFLVFIACLFIVAFELVGKASREDRYIR